MKNEKFEIFSISKSKNSLKLHQKLKLVKNNVGLFSRLFAASQTWDGDFDTFFVLKNQAAPPLLSENGSLKLPKKKSEILSCLPHDDSLSEALEIDAKVIDVAAIINMLKPTYSKTFRDNFIYTIVPYISSLLRQVERLGLVWDTLQRLKNCSREKHGVGVRRKVIGNCILPTSWIKYLRCSENKAELFPYCSRNNK